jgi:hypothetical protein
MRVSKNQIILAMIPNIYTCLQTIDLYHLDLYHLSLYPMYLYTITLKQNITMSHKLTNLINKINLIIQD